MRVPRNFKDQNKNDRLCTRMNGMRKTKTVPVVILFNIEIFISAQPNQNLSTHSLSSIIHREMHLTLLDYVIFMYYKSK